MTRYRTLLTTALLGGLLLASVALAQTLPGLPDFKVAGADPYALGGLVLLVMSSLKRAAQRRTPELVLSAWAWYGIALVLGVLAAFGLYTLKYGAELALFGLAFPWSVVMFGVVAGIIGAGGRDLLKTVSEWLSGARATVPDATTLPLDKTGEGAAAAEAYQREQALPPLPDATDPTGAVPLLGLPALGAGLLGSPLLEGMVKALLAAAGLPAGITEVLAVGARLAPIAPDLFADGNPQLSTDNLAKINRVILDLKHERGLS